MAINKSTQFSEEAQTLASFAKALSHPARLEILKVLAERKSCICGEIVEIMPLSQSTVSQHLKELKRLGLIKGTVEGVRSCYCIDWDFLQKQTGLWRSTISAILDNAPEKCCK